MRAHLLTELIASSIIGQSQVPSRVEPNRAEPNRTESNRTEPNTTERSRLEPNLPAGRRSFGTSRANSHIPTSYLLIDRLPTLCLFVRPLLPLKPSPTIPILSLLPPTITSLLALYSSPLRSPSKACLLKIEQVTFVGDAIFCKRRRTILSYYVHASYVARKLEKCSNTILSWDCSLLYDR